MLTVKMLDVASPGTILQSGVFLDEAGDVNINNSGRLLRYVVVAGGVHDWAVYVGRLNLAPSEIARYGDKISLSSAERLVNIDGDEVRKRYRP
jgi:hypothetical protein